jgi:sec-independent protein translocase protein TatA
MLGLGYGELIIILIIVLVLFGVGRISKIAGEMGSGIKAFKQGMREDESTETTVENEAGEPVNKS